LLSCPDYCKGAGFYHLVRINYLPYLICYQASKSSGDSLALASPGQSPSRVPVRPLFISLTLSDHAVQFGNQGFCIGVG